MFTAPLIENSPRYYLLTRRQWILLLLNPILIGLLIIYNLVSDEPISWWIAAPVIGVHIGIGIWTISNQRKLQTSRGNRTLVLDETTVAIKDPQKTATTSYDLSHVDRIILTKEYGIPGETVAELTQELRGNSKRNYLILERDGKQQQLDFVIDSFYALKQLDKVVEQWQQNGYPLKRQ